MPDDDPKLSNASTGPRTPGGKANSSQNRLDHGCCSSRALLDHEDPEHYEFTLEYWRAAYSAHAAGDPSLAPHIEETANAYWRFLRNQNRLAECESALPTHALDWTDAHHKQFGLFSRYATAAERAFFRWFRNLETLIKRNAREAAQREQALHFAADLEREWMTHKQASALGKTQPIQIVDVLGGEVETATSWFPTNEEIAAHAARSPEPLEFVTRFLFFHGGVPPEYDWVQPNPVQRAQRCVAFQRMPFSDWQQLVEAEKNSPHSLPRHPFLLSIWRPPPEPK